MMDKIMDLIKGQVQQTVENEPSIPDEKKAETVDVASGSIMNSLKSYLTPDNISSLTSMFSGGDHSGMNNKKSEITNGVQSNLISNLTSKLGLDSGIAQKLAAGLIPAILSKFTSKVNDSNEPDFNIGSLLNTFTGGGNSSSDSKGGLMDTIGGFFKK